MKAAGFKWLAVPRGAPLRHLSQNPQNVTASRIFGMTGPPSGGAKAETAIGRWKQVVGDGLRSRMDERRATEVDVAVYVLNRMLELGRPNYVRIN